MEKSKDYTNVKFPQAVIVEARDLFLKLADKHDSDVRMHRIRDGATTLEFDTDSEFFECYVSPTIIEARFALAMVDIVKTSDQRMWVTFRGDDSQISVSLPQRSQVEDVFNIFESNYENYKVEARAQAEQSITTTREWPWNKPTVIVEDTVRELVRRLEAFAGPVKITGRCADSNERSFPSLQELFALNNEGEREITALHLFASAPYPRLARAYLTLYRVRFLSNETAKLSVEGPEKTVYELVAHVRSVLDGTRPWYSPVYAYPSLWFLSALSLAPWAYFGYWISGSNTSDVPSLAELLLVFTPLLGLRWMILPLVIPVGIISLGAATKKYGDRLKQTGAFLALVSFLVAVVLAVLLR